MIRWIVVKIIASALALWLADRLLGGLVIAGGLRGYLLAGAVLGLLNGLVRPVVKLVTLPLILLTLGFFTVIINIAMLALAAHLLPDIISIHGLTTLLWATLIVSLVNLLFNQS